MFRSSLIQPGRHCARPSWGWTCLMGLLMASPCAWGQSQSAQEPVLRATADSLFVDLPAQSLNQSIQALARQFQVGIGFDARLDQGRSAPALRGTYTVHQALERVLTGSGLRAVRVGSGLVLVADNSSATLSEVTVRSMASTADELPESYAGGQVARGSRVGMLGNRDFMDTPFNTLSYTEQAIRDRQAQEVSSIVGATDPSVYVSGSTGMIEDAFKIRGFAVNTRDIGFGGLFGVMPYYRIPTELAERVEVHKGPTALLNGMPPGGSVGGSVNLVPKRAGEQALTRITGTYATDAQFGTHVDVGRRFGEQQQLGVRFNGVYRDGDSAVDQQSKKTTLAALGLDWRNDRVRLSLDAYTAEDHVSGLNRGISLASTSLAVPAAPDASTLLSPDWTFSTTQTDALVLRGEVDVTRDFTVYAAYGYAEHDFDALASSVYSVTNSAGDYSNNFSHQRMKQDANTAELGGRINFSTGAVRHEAALSTTYYQHDYHFGFLRNMLASSWLTNIYNPQWGSSVDTSYSSASLPKTAALRQLSYGVADTMSMFDDRVQLTLGLRRQQIKSETFDSASGARTALYDVGDNTPAAALLFKLNQQLSLYGNYIEGLSQGSTAPSTAANAGEVFAPYKTRQQELGVKLDLGRFASTLSVFQIRKPNSMTDATSNIYSQGGEQRNRGLELNVFGLPMTGVRLMGGVSYTQPTLTRTANGANQGRDATATPRWQGKLGAEWDVHGIPGLTLNGNMVTMSKQYIDENNARWVAGRTVYDVGARYAMTLGQRPVTLRATVLNVFDKDYWAGSLTSGLGAPRTLMLSASVDL